MIPVDPPNLSTQSTQSATVTGRSIIGSSEMRYNFSTRFLLPQADAVKLLSLSQKMDREGRRGDTVVYYLWDIHTDLGTQTREAVPGLPVISEGGMVTYYPAIQGDVVVTGSVVGAGSSGPWYELTLAFYEGRIRRP